MYLSTKSELESFCELASAAKVIAVDTEFLRERTYFPKLCLVQVAAGEHIAAIDPILIEDLSPLAELLANPTLTKVFHACGQDLEVLLDGMGVSCAPVFDTQLAAAFLGLRQQISYASLVEAYCGVRLPKAESLTDWSRRPLDPEQLTYAEDDVRYLDEVCAGVVRHYDELTRKLEGALDRQRPERIYRCDRSILLVALCEMLYMPEIPPKVSVNEAIELSKIYSTEKSGGFINGILSNFLPGGSDHGEDH